jgi:hypothetical protein
MKNPLEWIRYKHSRDKRMKAFLINPQLKEVTEVEIEPSIEAIQDLIGFKTVDSDEIDFNFDQLFFDEECFIRQQDQAGRFKVDNLAPIAGKGVVANSANNGKTIASPQVTLEALIKRVTFL